MAACPLPQRRRRYAVWRESCSRTSAFCLCGTEFHALFRAERTCSEGNDASSACAGQIINKCDTNTGLYFSGRGDYTTLNDAVTMIPFFLRSRYTHKQMTLAASLAPCAQVLKYEAGPWFKWASAAFRPCLTCLS